MSSGLLVEPDERFTDGNLLKHMHKLMEHGYGTDIWRHGGTIAQLVMAHFIRLEDPDKWAQIDSANSYAGYMEAMNVLRDVLSMNPQVCQLLEALWSSRSDIATYINSASAQMLANHMVNVHPRFVMGCGKYLSCNLKTGWSDLLDFETRFCSVQAAVTTYVAIVQNLPLDAGHWHELWAAGDDVGLCLMEHFFRHEDQRDERWGAEHVRNPAKYLNRNLQNLRDIVASNPSVCTMLSALKMSRPDIWAEVDGRALQRMASHLLTEELLLGCGTFLAQNLLGNWTEGLSNPRAEVQRFIDLYIANRYQMLGLPPPAFPSSPSPRQARANSSTPSSPFYSPRRAPRSPSHPPSPTAAAMSPSAALTAMNHQVGHIFTHRGSPTLPSAAFCNFASHPVSPPYTPDSTHSSVFDIGHSPVCTPVNPSPYSTPPSSPRINHPFFISPFFNSASPTPTPEPSIDPINMSHRTLAHATSFSFHPPASAPILSPLATPLNIHRLSPEVGHSPKHGPSTPPTTTPMSPTLDPIISYRQVREALPTHRTISSPGVSPRVSPTASPRHSGTGSSMPGAVAEGLTGTLDIWEMQTGAPAEQVWTSSPVPPEAVAQVVVPVVVVEPSSAPAQKDLSPTSEASRTLQRLPTLSLQPSY